MHKITILAPSGVPVEPNERFQTIISSHPDLTKEQWRNLCLELLKGLDDASFIDTDKLIK